MTLDNSHLTFLGGGQNSWWQSDKGKGGWRVEGNYLEVGTSKETEFLAAVSGPWVME